VKGFGRTGALLLAAAAFLVPQLWLASISLKPKAAVYEYPPRWISPGASLANYAFVMGGTQVPWYLWNSAKVAALATLLTLAGGLPAAFVLSRERFRGRSTLLGVLLALQMVSPIVLLVPIYRMIAGARLIDTHAGLVLVYAAVLWFVLVAPKRSRISLAQSRRAARNFATSSMRLLWALKKNDSCGAKASTSRPASRAAVTYATPLASVNATSCTAVQPASRT